MDRQKMMMTDMIQRSDSNVPLEGFSLAKLQKLREKLELPDQFLRACTLREGTWVVVLFLNCVALAVIGYLVACLTIMRPIIDKWWYDRFRDDFDFYYQGENKELIAELWPLWVPISYAIIGTKGAYVFTGLLVFYALIKKTVHPCWYMPWLLMSGFLCSVMWLIAGTMIISIFVLLTYRPITVTWDLGPIVLVIAYSYMWSYFFFVVVAHYKRRCIVKYWRDRNVIVQVGSDSFPTSDTHQGQFPEGY